MSYRGKTALALLLGSFAFACDDPTLPETTAVFEIQVTDETFRVGVNNPAQIDSLDARLASGAEGNLNGALRDGDGGVNEPWSWHLDPETVHVADFTAEVCDGRPSFVEDDLE